MDKKSLTAVARQQLALAKTTTSGRSSQTLCGGHTHSLRQTVIALTAGQSLAEHDSPGEATLQVLTGTLTLISGAHEWKGSPGDLLVLPAARHSVQAVDDVAFLLTVAK
ncbi:cupin domain-containing protein [Nocardia stercoris]|uniref:LuxR family transcriptional regulator n=1 Tax=Nocardia stercoris TaxID=2483361 RepID=A0A3M2L0D0_9NOCA|nr:cupin domain-containing protein [Nocardia stercoris]RMI31011.1 LuxR family transcriptional regulator [Nocardia stercoris]